MSVVSYNRIFTFIIKKEINYFKTIFTWTSTRMLIPVGNKPGKRWLLKRSDEVSEKCRLKCWLQHGVSSMMYRSQQAIHEETAQEIIKSPEPLYR